MPSERLIRALVLAAVVWALVVAAASAPAALPDPPQAAPVAEDEPYHLKADRLSGSMTSEEDVYTATRVTVQHGVTTVVGDSARIFRSKELVILKGNVKIVDGTTTMLGDEASYDRKSKVAVLKGNVRIKEGGARITGREARFFRAENRSVIVGSPRLEDSTRTITATEIEYDRGRDIVTASGNVDAIDRAESTHVRAGKIRYDRRLDYAWATEDPVLTLDEAGGKSTQVRGLTLEFDNAKRRVFALGNVRIERDQLRAEGERAEFYQSEERALLLGKPRAWDDEGTVQGDTLEIRFAQHRIKSLQVRPNATVDFQTKSEVGRGERNHAVGDTVTLYLGEEAARQAVIVGHAQSLYWPSSADSAEGGRNISSGDSIIVDFEDGKARRATVVGKSQGTYFMAAEGDTTRARMDERVQYRGARIVYDVAKSKVYVIGAADVVYKEMQLNAERVEFDSKTQRMRAEGKPVLVDGKDRITGHTMTYDLSIRRGTVLGGRTTYERGFYYGKRIRKVSDDVLDVEDGSYSTCELTEPHYHFGSSRMKIIFRDKVIARPVVFYVKHVPVLALPFYVFPIKPGRHSGFELPQVEFGSSTSGGKFLRNLGYYWAINDYLDATFWGDYYQAQSWVAHLQTRYSKRYRWQGEINTSLERRFATDSQRWDLFGRHYQILGPNFSLTAQGNLTNSSAYLRDQLIGRSLLMRVQRNLHSSVSLQKGWSGSSLIAGFTRDQDLDPNPNGPRLTQQLPSVTFSLTARPIGHLARGKEPAKLPALATTVFSVRSTILSQKNVFVDSTATRDQATDSRVAARSDLTVTDTRALLGFLRVSPNMSYSEVFYSRDAAGNRYQRAGVWRGGVGMNTAVFGTFRPSLGPLQAFRHVVTPSVTFNYQPSYPKLFYRNPQGVLGPRFSGVSGITVSASEARSLGFSLRNDLHVKWGSAAQPKIINNLIQLQTSGGYDFLAKRSGRKPLSDLSSFLRLQPGGRGTLDFNFLHNPYDRRLLQFGASTGLFFQGVRRAPQTQEQEETPDTYGVRAPTGWAPEGLTPAGLPWTVAMSLSYSGSRSRQSTGGYSAWQSSSRINGSLGLNPTKNWRLDYSAQYDLRSRLLISQNYSVKRDLHCWEAQFTRSISGETSEFYFKINVKNLSEVYYERGSRGLRGFGGIQNMF